VELPQGLGSALPPSPQLTGPGHPQYSYNCLHALAPSCPSDSRAPPTSPHSNLTDIQGKGQLPEGREANR